MKELKVDLKLPHHYFISVAVKINCDTLGELFLKYRPFYISNSQIKDLRKVVILSKDEMFKTTEVEALKMYNLLELANSFSMFKISSKVNQCTMHHFSSEHKIDEEWFDFLVKQSNTNKKMRELLTNARINY